MSQERFLELKEKIQTLGAGGFKKLSLEEQTEYQALKAEFGGEVKPVRAESVSVPKDLLQSLITQIEELKANQQGFLGKGPAEVLPGQAVAVNSGSKTHVKMFKRFRETSEKPWEYVADVKWLKFSFDREIEEKVNLFKITSVSSNGDIKIYEMKDSDFARMGEGVVLKITDKESKEFEVQDRLTPIITTAVNYKDSSNPKSVTGVDAEPVGPVKNMIRYKETYFTVHIPADTDAEGREVVDTVSSPTKVTFRIADNLAGKAGVHLEPNSIKII